MTITQQSDYILGHPAFKNAINAYSQGDTEPLKDILQDIQMQCIYTQILNSAKEYGLCKRMNSSDIKEQLSNMRLPTNLDVKLKIPAVKKDECKVISFTEKISQIKKRVQRILDPQQLSFSFPNLGIANQA